MNRFITELHEHLRGALLTRTGATHHPSDVQTGQHKTYERMEVLRLPEPQPIATTLADALTSRRSGLQGDTSTPLNLELLGTLFGLTLRKKAGSMKRHYPSGGMLYPIETYLLSMALQGEPPSAYHYNPTTHVLEKLWVLPPELDLKDVAKQPRELELSSLIVFTSVWNRASAKYGDLAYPNALLEAGHMSENILLTGGALGLSMRPYAGFNDILVSQLLDLDTRIEQPVHTITLCYDSKYTTHTKDESHE